MIESPSTVLGMELRRLRTKVAKLSIPQAVRSVKEAGGRISVGSLHQIEVGRSSPRIDLIIALCDCYSAPLRDVFEFILAHTENGGSAPSNLNHALRLLQAFPSDNRAEVATTLERLLDLSSRHPSPIH